MLKKLSKQQQARRTITIFLSVLTFFSSFAYYAILKLNPTSIYVGALMLSPALAAFVTLKILKRPLSTLPWRLKELKYLKFAYITPILYTSMAYILIWSLGFGDFFNTNQILDWSKELGIEGSGSFVVAVVMIFLLFTVGVVKNIGSTLGEEIGWRGFFIFELRKIFSFKWVSLISGLIWSIWHWPVIYLMYNGSGNLMFHIIAFTIMIVGMSFILAYYTFKSKSLWPAALYHSVHNIYIQKICTPLTITNETSTFWIDEYGLMIPIMTTLFGLYFWRKARKENL